MRCSNCSSCMHVPAATERAAATRARERSRAAGVPIHCAAERHPLLSLEKIAIGGVNSVRGYPEHLLVRENGVAATLELQLPIFGYRRQPNPLSLVLVPFVDYGRSRD